MTIEKNEAAGGASRSDAGLGCFFIFHRWPKWRDIQRGPIQNRDGDNIGWYIRQERRCGKCGKVELRDENTDAYRAPG